MAFNILRTMAIGSICLLVSSCGKEPSSGAKAASKAQPASSVASAEKASAPVAKPPAQSKAKAAARPSPAWKLVDVTIPKRGPNGALKLSFRPPQGQPEAVAVVTPVLVKAWAWAKQLDPNPVRLRAELNMSGKKHFVEYLALLRLIAGWPGTPKEVKAAVIARAHEVLKWTDEAAYHDMGEVDDGRFRNQSMSYLRAAVLADEFGWDTAPYRAQIKRISQRLTAHLAARGIDQQMSFAVLYKKLGLSGAVPRAELYPRSRIARLTNFKYWVSHPKKVYDFTHEVFAMTGRGARRFPFTRPIEAKYARKVAHTLLHIHMTEKNHDGVAELLVNRVLLGDKPDPQFGVARKFLISGQDAQGRFGIYDQAEIRQAFKRPHYDVNYGGHLHTTMVALWALMLTS